MAQDPPMSVLARRLWFAVRRAPGTKMKTYSVTQVVDTAPTTVCTSAGRNTSCETPRPAPLSSLGSLPLELQLMIFHSLSYESLLRLGATNKHFRSMIRRDHIVAALYRDEDTIRDHCNVRKERLACFQCYRLRSAFFDFDVRGIQPKFTAKGAEAGKRRCLICLMPRTPAEYKSTAGRTARGKP